MTTKPGGCTLKEGMKLEELKEWNKLSKVEKDRLRKVYGKSPDITQTTAQKAKKGLYYIKDRRQP